MNQLLADSDTTSIVTPRTPYELLPEQMTAAEVQAWTRLSRWAVYDLIRRGDLPVKRYGRSVRVPKSAINSLRA